MFSYGFCRLNILRTTTHTNVIKKPDKLSILLLRQIRKVDEINTNDKSNHNNNDNREHNSHTEQMAFYSILESNAITLPKLDTVFEAVFLVW